MKKVTRFELFDPNGRVCIHYAVVEYDVQDDGLTLKVFTPETIPRREHFTVRGLHPMYDNGSRLPAPPGDDGKTRG
jgi:hypothetical protein